jgi:hypothetical protein
MKRKAKVHRSRDLPPPPDVSETVVGLSGAPATPGRSSIERVDEHKTGSIESVPPTGPENGVAGFIEPERPDAGGAR